MTACTEAALAPAHTDWLHHRMSVTGLAADLAAFRKAAAGAGTVPWRLDLDRIEENLFVRLVDPARRTLSVAGARVLAGQLREAIERRQALAVAQIGRSTACSLDLHALVPVPETILRLGPDDPAALAWLCANWGTTEPLRHVDPASGRHSAPGRHPDPGGRTPVAAQREEEWRLSFWSADWTPWRALVRIRSDWPTLHFDVRPTYDDL